MSKDGTGVKLESSLESEVMTFLRLLASNFY